MLTHYLICTYYNHIIILSNSSPNCWWRCVCQLIIRSNSTSLWQVFPSTKQQYHFLNGPLGAHTKRVPLQSVITLHDSSNEAPLLMHCFQGQGEGCVCVCAQVCVCLAASVNPVKLKRVPWSGQLIKTIRRRDPIEYINFMHYRDNVFFLISKREFHWGLSLHSKTAFCENNWMSQWKKVTQIELFNKSSKNNVCSLCKMTYYAQGLGQFMQ